MELKEMQKELNNFGKYVVQQSRSNLTKKKHNATKELYNSIGYFVDKTAQGYKLSFEMEDYGMFQDQGVKGVKSNYIVNKNSPFSYKQSSNLIGLEYHTGVFSKFAKRMGLQPRNKKGQFGSYKTMGYILARSIKNKGIKASMFFTKPFEQAFKRLPEDLAETLAKDITNNI
tara:strand:+ start:2147 stop:2662 length:516 start_codon:yes stop_codon:yes gene_type:complete